MHSADTSHTLSAHQPRSSARVGSWALPLLLAAACSPAGGAASMAGSGGGGGHDEVTAGATGGAEPGGQATTGSAVGAGGGAGTGGEAGTGGAGGTGGSAGETGTGGGDACFAATTPCETEEQCCDDLSCDTTTLGRVCCGEHGAPCATANGEECCRDLLCIGGSCLPPGGAPDFQAPFPCGETWTYSHHGAEVRRAVDFVNTDGATDARPLLASAAGTATRHFEAGGAGNYVVITHGGGWSTYYFHLQSFSIADGATVEQGQEIGLVGSTGASSGPHIHYEQLRDGVGQDIWLNGEALAPYPGQYFQASVTSANCPDR